MIAMVEAMGSASDPAAPVRNRSTASAGKAVIIAVAAFSRASAPRVVARIALRSSRCVATARTGPNRAQATVKMDCS